MFAIDTFWKHEVAHDILVIDAVIMLTVVEEMKLIDAFVTCVCYWYILKAYKSIWQIGDEYCDYTGIRNGIYRYFITHVFDNDTFWKHVVAHDDWWWMLLL